MIYIQKHFLLITLVKGISTCFMEDATSISNDDTGICYHIFSGAMNSNFNNAKSSCESMAQTHLVHLENSTEQLWLYDQLVALGLPTRFWMGIIEENNEWHWINGASRHPVTQTRFSNTLSGVAYAIADKLTWKMMQRSNNFPYVCEEFVASELLFTSSSSWPLTSLPTTSSQLSRPESAQCLDAVEMNSNLTDVQLHLQTEKPDVFSCFTLCVNKAECTAIKYDTKYQICSVYEYGLLMVSCGIHKSVLCYRFLF